MDHRQRREGTISLLLDINNMHCFIETLVLGHQFLNTIVVVTSFGNKHPAILRSYYLHAVSYQVIGVVHRNLGVELDGGSRDSLATTKHRYAPLDVTGRLHMYMYLYWLYMCRRRGVAACKLWMYRRWVDKKRNRMQDQHAVLQPYTHSVQYGHTL